MSIREFYNELKKKDKSSKLSQLYLKPLKEKGVDMPKIQIFKPNYEHQADLLYMPHDKGYKYILVVSDSHNKKIDAEPIKSKVQGDNEILEAFKKIYSRKILTFPKILKMDNGTEFKSTNLKNYFENNEITLKYGVPGRHRQQTIVERANNKIGSILLKRMTAQELLTGQKSTEWVDDLSELITVLNENLPPATKKPKSENILFTKYSGNIIPKNTNVRILLEHPQDTVKGNWLSGGFRAGDIRWSPVIHKITDIILKPLYPPMYIIDDDYNVARTKQQLQIVSENEKLPNNKFIRGNQDTFIIDKIINKRKKGLKVEYLIKWVGFDDSQNSWISSKELDRTKELRNLKKIFNQN
jgi:hypothetical protein